MPLIFVESRAGLAGFVAGGGGLRPGERTFVGGLGMGLGGGEDEVTCPWLGGGGKRGGEGGGRKGGGSEGGGEGAGGEGLRTEQQKRFVAGERDGRQLRCCTARWRCTVRSVCCVFVAGR